MATEIWTAEDFNNIRHNVSESFGPNNNNRHILGNYIQMADIDLSGFGNWIPLGEYYAHQEGVANYFSASYDGNGYKITGLTSINPIGSSSSASPLRPSLFGDLTSHGGPIVIKNLTVENAVIKVTNYEFSIDSNTGVIAGVGWWDEITFENCHVLNAEVENTGGIPAHIGGIVGWNGGEINNCTVKNTTITVGEEAAYIGLITGFCYGIHRCYAEGAIISYNGGSQIGGLCGSLYGWKEGMTGSATECYANVDITITHPSELVWSNWAVGGLFGTHFNSAGKKIKNCYARGSITGGVYAVGGLVGVIDEGSEVIENCYAAVEVSGTDGVGGLLGYNYSESDVTLNCYYDSEVSGQSDTGKGVPKTTAEIKNINTYLPEWDFSTIWAISPTVNDGYPFFGSASLYNIFTKIQGMWTSIVGVWAKINGEWKEVDIEDFLNP